MLISIQESTHVYLIEMQASIKMNVTYEEIEEGGLKQIRLSYKRLCSII
jgi:hypothetical protein